MKFHFPRARHSRKIVDSRLITFRRVNKANMKAMCSRDFPERAGNSRDGEVKNNSLSSLRPPPPPPSIPAVLPNSRTVLASSENRSPSRGFALESVDARVVNRFGRSTRPILPRELLIGPSFSRENNLTDARHSRRSPYLAPHYEKERRTVSLVDSFVSSSVSTYRLA